MFKVQNQTLRFVGFPVPDIFLSKHNLFDRLTEEETSLKFNERQYLLARRFAHFERSIPCFAKIEKLGLLPANSFNYNASLH